MERSRRFPWLRFLLALCLAAIVAVRTGDAFGDHGAQNFITGVIGLVALLAVLVAFAVSAHVARRVRVGVLLGLAVTLGVAGVLFRYEGLSGELVPHFRARFAARPELPTVAPGAVAVLAPPAGTDFPGFLGARRDNRVADPGLRFDFEAAPPRRLWRAPIGSGWAGFAVAGGLAFTLEQDGTGQRASAREARGGGLVWSVLLDAPFSEPLGGPGPRATPTVELTPEPGRGRVFVLSAHGRLACLAAESGAVLWSHDLGAEHGWTRAEERAHLPYGRSSSPLVAGELVIVPAGGDAGLVAFDAAGGAERWRSPARVPSQSSPALATLGGVEQVLCVNEDTLSGHALRDGRLLWERAWPGRSAADASVSQPYGLDGERVFVSKGYGGGALLLALELGADGTFGTRDLWHAPRVLRTKFTNAALHAGHAFGLDDGILSCVELERGERRWKEGRYGHGQLLLVGEHLLLVSEEGEVLALAADPERPNDVLGRFQGLTGKCWAPIALAGDVLFLRNAEECAAWELARGQAGER
jgi:outer membrane protein assembly factor BamB